MLIPDKGVSMSIRKKIYCQYVKRALDIVFSIALIILLLLPMFLIAVIIRCDSEGNAIFRQRRVGRGGKIFTCYKFRTMYTDAPRDRAAADFKDIDRYITRTGRFLRRSSLDELPQLFNVFLGQMSLIGPRPLICEEGDMHRRRMEEGVYTLRPGITGVSQVSGRNMLGDEDKLTGDVYYLENVRLLLDVKILLRTLIKVFSGEGVKAERKDKAQN